MNNTEHDIVDDGVSSHNGEYWYRCTKCGMSDWIASYGTIEQLNFYYHPCNETLKKDKSDQYTEHDNEHWNKVIDHLAEKVQELRKLRQALDREFEAINSSIHSFVDALQNKK